MRFIRQEQVQQPLALEGGSKVRKQPLPWEFPGAHYIDEAEIDLVTKVMCSKSPFRYYGIELQHMVDQLEQAFKDKFNMPFALAVNSGTAALHIALSAMGVGPGDEVLLPGYLWVSCVSAIVRLGAIPRLVDIDDTFCLSPIDLKKKLTSRSKVVMFVHMSGATGHIKEVADIAKENNLYLLEDVAQSLGTNIQGKYVGTFGDAAIFSFQLNKNMTSGEGGMIICHDEQLYKRCFACHDLGYPRNAEGRLDLSDGRYQLWGVGSRMSELTGAMALAQFNKVEDVICHMRQAKWNIREALQDLKKIQFRSILDPKGDSGCFLITLYPSAEICQRFTNALVEEGIQGPTGSLACVPMEQWGLHWYFNIASLTNKTSWCQDGFPWSHPKNAFAHAYQYMRGTLPSCDDYASRAAILAIASNLSDKDITDIVTAFHKVYYHLLREE